MTGLGPDQYLEHVQTVDISEQWATHLTWLPWICTGENECELQAYLGICLRFISQLRIGIAIIVHCTSDGAVGLVRVTRTCHIEAGGSEFGHRPVLATNVIRSQGF